MNIERINYLQQIKQLLKTFPVVALLGPRQCGKTTLARMFIENKRSTHYFDLEDPVDCQRLENPKSTLENLEGLIIIDEIQRQPELFDLLRVLVDEHKSQQFLILGSASRHLIQHSSDTLAGRLAYIEVTPFCYQETRELEKLWLRGGFPKSYLADDNLQSVDWRKFYVRSFLEQDIPNLGFRIPAQQMRRFWLMLSHYHGQTFNASELGVSLGLSHTTIKHYADILIDTFMIRQLQPWFENIKKRQVKTPKIYFRDSGIYHTLVSINQQSELLTHPKLGASWEGFALEEIINHHQAESEDCYYWGIHNQAELDLLIIKEGKRLGFEIKFKDAPRLTKSMQLACEHLKLDKLTVIYPGQKDYALNDQVEVRGLLNCLED